MSTQVRVLTPRMVGLMVFVVAVYGFTPLILSGKWNWWGAWVYAVISAVGFAASRLLAGWRNPDLIDERARSIGLQDAKPWDKILAPVVALGGILIAITAGLDHRYSWSVPFPLWAKIAATIIIILGYCLGTWAMLENRFFSGVVRIQLDRGHTVVSTGPYAWIRHPGYAGTIVVYLLTPVLLDSIWAFIPALILVTALIIRTSLEDQTLQAELRGYREFTKKTRYQLFPGIW